MSARAIGLATAALAVASLSQAHAASVSYFLDRSNTTPPFSDGNNYVTVTIDDEGGIGTKGGDSIITFTVATVGGTFTSTPGSFGIQTFGFNHPNGFITGDSPSNEWILPANWDGILPPPNKALGGFGKFDAWVDASGASNRRNPLVFSIDVAGDSINSYFAPSDQDAEQGNAWFAAHVAGFTTGVLDGEDEEITSAWFGGGDGPDDGPTPVPIPATFWLFGSGLAGLAGVTRRRTAG